MVLFYVNGIFYLDVAFSIENRMNARAFHDVFKVLKVARAAGECNLKTTSISKLQNIKIKRDNYSVYAFEQHKEKYIL